MELPALVEPVAGNGYVAKTGEPLPLRAEGPTADAALDNLRQLIACRLGDASRIVPVADATNPWVEFAGMFKDDPYFDEWQAAIAENRRTADQDLDLP